MSYLPVKFILFIISTMIPLCAGLSPVLAKPEDAYRINRFDYKNIRDLAWRADGRYLAVAAEEGVYILDSQFMPEQTLRIASSTYLWSVAWSKDGNWLAVSSFEPCWLMVWQQVSSTFVLKYQLPSCGQLRWDAWSDWLAVVGTNRRDGSTLIFNVNDTEKPLVRVIDCQDAQDVAFSSTRPLIACANAHNHLVIWNTSTQTVVGDIPGGGSSVDWSEDGNQLLTTMIAGKKAVLSIAEVGPTMLVRAYNSLYIWDVSQWSNVESISIAEDYVTVWNALWIDENQILIETSTLAGDFYSDGVSILQPDTGEFSASFSLGGGSSSGGLHALSPNRKYFSGFTYWRSTWLKVGVLDGTDTVIELPGIAAAWTPDGNYLTAVDADGWLYHYDIPHLMLAQK